MVDITLSGIWSCPKNQYICIFTYGAGHVACDDSTISSLHGREYQKEKNIEDFPGGGDPVVIILCILPVVFQCQPENSRVSYQVL